MMYLQPVMGDEFEGFWAVALIKSTQDAMKYIVNLF